MTEFLQKLPEIVHAATASLAIPKPKKFKGHQFISLPGCQIINQYRLPMSRTGQVRSVTQVTDLFNQQDSRCTYKVIK